MAELHVDVTIERTQTQQVTTTWTIHTDEYDRWRGSSPDTPELRRRYIHTAADTPDILTAQATLADASRTWNTTGTHLTLHDDTPPPGP